LSEILQNLSAFAVFLGIAGFGFVFLLLSLLFGEIFEHFGDIDHDVDHGAPTFFSPRVVSVFIAGFGAAGAIASVYGASTMVASGIGFASGIMLASVILMFAKFLYGQQASTSMAPTDVLGQTARVVVGIPSGGVGQVRCKVGEELVDRIARSKDGSAIAENTTVKIEEVLGEIVIVRKV
jgi:membrane protein implicated in regulation of membrane protease activity